jgi:hypothetical protein
MGRCGYRRKAEGFRRGGHDDRWVLALWGHLTCRQVVDIVVENWPAVVAIDSASLLRGCRGGLLVLASSSSPGQSAASAGRPMQGRNRRLALSAADRFSARVSARAARPPYLCDLFRRRPMNSADGRLRRATRADDVLVGSGLSAGPGRRGRVPGPRLSAGRE